MKTVLCHESLYPYKECITACEKSESIAFTRRRRWQRRPTQEHYSGGVLWNPVFEGMMLSFAECVFIRVGFLMCLWSILNTQIQNTQGCSVVMYLCAPHNYIWKPSCAMKTYIHIKTYCFRLFCEHIQDTDSMIYQCVLQLSSCVLHTTIYENRLVPWKPVSI